MINQFLIVCHCNIFVAHNKNVHACKGMYAKLKSILTLDIPSGGGQWRLYHLLVYT